MYLKFSQFINVQNILNAPQNLKDILLIEKNMIKKILSSIVHINI